MAYETRYYFISKQSGKWSVFYNARRAGQFQWKRDAIRCAVEWAHNDGREGTNSHVVLQGDESRFQVLWTYGQDAYPPTLYRLDLCA
jgi:hypothetical protein